MNIVGLALRVLRVSAFVVLTLAGCFVVVASPRFAGWELLGYIVVAGAAWWLTGLLVRRPKLVPVRIDRPRDISLEFVLADGARDAAPQGRAHEGDAARR